MNTDERDGYQLIRQAIPPTDLQPFRQCIQTQVGIQAQQLWRLVIIDMNVTLQKRCQVLC